MPNREYPYEGSSFYEVGSIVSETVVYEGIALPAGVYRVELEYDTDTDLAAWCNVKDGTVFTGALLCNGEHLYSALDKTGYHMWLYEATEHLQVIVSGSGSLETGNLKIVETNRLWTMLMTVLVFCAFIGYGVIVYYYYDKKYTVAFEKKNTFFFVMLIAFVASLPYLCGYTIGGADLTYHLQRIEGVKDGLMTGQFPIRLEPRWVYDHGYANGIFYCNALLYFPAILRMLGFTVTASYNAYAIVLNIATAWIAYYCFGKMFQSRNIGIVSSALYTLSVYRIYKLIEVGAVGEGSAMTFMPLIIYGLYRVFTEEPKKEEFKTAWIPLMFGYAGLIQTHVLTSEITAFVTIALCLLNIQRFRYKNVWLEFVKGAAGTVALCLWYLVPFLDYYITQDIHIRNVSARTIQETGLLFPHLLVHFWEVGGNEFLSSNGWVKTHSTGVGFVLFILLAVFIVLWVCGVFKKAEGGKLAFVKGVAVIAVVLLFMSTYVFPWDSIQEIHPVIASLVSSLQFTHRFLGWGTLCMIIVIAFMMRFFEKERIKVYWVLVAAAFLAVSTSGMYYLDSIKADPEKLELYNEEGMGFGYISGAEYLMEGTNQGLLSFANPKMSGGVEISGYEKSGLRAEFACANGSESDGYVDLPMLLYRGYRAYDAGTGQELEISAGENNVIRVEVPAGFSGEIEVEFVSPVYWRISEIVSVLALVAFLVMWRRNTKPAVKEVA